MGDSRRQRQPNQPSGFDKPRPAESQAEKMQRAREATEDAARQLENVVSSLEAGGKARRAKKRATASTTGASLSSEPALAASAASAWLEAPPLDLSLKLSMRVTSSRPFDWLKRTNAAKARAVGGFARCEPPAVECVDAAPESLAESFHQALCYWTFPTTERLRVRTGGERRGKRPGLLASLAPVNSPLSAPFPPPQ